MVMNGYVGGRDWELLFGPEKNLSVCLGQSTFYFISSTLDTVILGSAHAR